MHPQGPRSPRTLLAAVLLLLAGALAGFIGGLAVCEQRLARLHATQAHELQQLRADQHQLRGLCRKFCSGGREGAVAHGCGGD